jgi:hypothetical protein
MHGSAARGDALRSRTGPGFAATRLQAVADHAPTLAAPADAPLVDHDHDRATTAPTTTTAPTIRRRELAATEHR